MSQSSMRLCGQSFSAENEDNLINEVDGIIANLQNLKEHDAVTLKALLKEGRRRKKIDGMYKN